MIGICMGGIETWLAASVDERVAVAVPLIGVQSFRWSLENDKWQGRANTIKAAHEAAAKDLGEPAVNQKVCRALWNKVIPGILDEFDCPSMLRLFAGRPLFIVNGDAGPELPDRGGPHRDQSAEAAFDEGRGEGQVEGLDRRGRRPQGHRRAEGRGAGLVREVVEAMNTLLLALAMSPTADEPAVAADLVLVSGKVWTVDRDQPGGRGRRRLARPHPQGRHRRRGQGARRPEDEGDRPEGPARRAGLPRQPRPLPRRRAAARPAWS